MDILTIKKLRNLNTIERNNKILEVQHALFQLRFKQSTKQPIRTDLFKKYKIMHAQLLTIEHNSK